MTKMPRAILPPSRTGVGGTGTDGFDLSKAGPLPKPLDPFYSTEMKNSKLKLQHFSGNPRLALAFLGFSLRLLQPSKMSSQILRSASRTVKSFLSASRNSPLLAVYMLQEHKAQAAELECTFIAIKPDEAQRGLIAEIISRFESKGYKLVDIKLVVPTKEFVQKHYHDLKEIPIFNVASVIFLALVLSLHVMGR